MTIRGQLVASQALAAIAVLIGMAIFYGISSAAAERELADKLTSTAELLGHSSTSALVFMDTEAATEVLLSLQVDAQILNACIFDGTGDVFAAYERSDIGTVDNVSPPSPGTWLGDDQIEVVVPVQFDGDDIGLVYLRSDLRWLATRRRELLQQTTILLLIGGSISTFLLLLLQRSIAAPVRRLADASTRVADRGEHVQVSGGSTDELLALAEAFNRMVQQVHERDRSLREARDTLEQRVAERTNELRLATELIQDELDARQAAEERIQVLVDSAAAGMLVVDAEGLICLVNEHFLTILGYTRKELIGQPAVMLVPEEAREIHARDLREFIDDPQGVGRGRLQGLYVRRKDGRDLPMELGLAPMQTAEGVFVSMVAIDVTDRKKAMEELQQARDLAERTNAAKSAFMANISHELRTPLNGIIGAGEILQNGTFGQLSPQQQTFIETVMTSGQQLLVLIDDIVDVARMEAGQVDLAPGAVDLQSIIEDLRTSFGERATHKGLVFEIDQRGDVPSAILIDGRRLRQALASLIDNGIKFTDEGKVSLRVHGTAASQPDHCQLSFRISDTGPGIPEDQQQGIFQAFSQRDGQSINEYGGIGIGLAMTHRIVQGMGGRIEVQSIVAKGSTFEILLPDVPVASTADAAPRTETAPAAVTPPQETIPAWQPETLAPAVKARLPQLVATLEKDILASWEEASRTLIVNEAESLGVRAGDLGRDFAVEPLTEWGDRLQFQASTFQMDDMPKTLAEFPGLVEQLKAATA